MFDFSFGELALIVLVALLVVGPKDLPRVMYSVGKWFGQFKGLTDGFKEGFRNAMKEQELEHIEKELTAVSEDIQYIRDSDGKLQRIYHIGDFLDERERTKVTVQTEQEKKTS